MPTKIPTLTPCTSSAIAAHGFDPATQTLFLTFTSGTTYSYQEVSNDTYAALQAAESVGRFYGANIKGKFIAVPVPVEPAAADSEGGETD
jgi:hypothetical protein